MHEEEGNNNKILISICMFLYAGQKIASWN